MNYSNFLETLIISPCPPVHLSSCMSQSYYLNIIGSFEIESHIHEQVWVIIIRLCHSSTWTLLGFEFLELHICEELFVIIIRFCHSRTYLNIIVCLNRIEMRNTSNHCQVTLIYFIALIMVFSIHLRNDSRLPISPPNIFFPKYEKFSVIYGACSLGWY